MRWLRGWRYNALMWLLGLGMVFYVLKGADNHLKTVRASERLCRATGGLVLHDDKNKLYCAREGWRLDPI